MGQSWSATSCCSCLLDGWGSSRSYAAAIKPSAATSNAVILNPDVQQPLVVEDESWKKWSSYNLIHHKNKSSVHGSDNDSNDDLYNPPMYISQQQQQQQQQSAEAVWDL